MHVKNAECNNKFHFKPSIWKRLWLKRFEEREREKKTTQCYTFITHFVNWYFVRCSIHPEHRNLHRPLFIWFRIRSCRNIISESKCITFWTAPQFNGKTRHFFSGTTSLIPYIPAKSLPWVIGTGSFGAKYGPFSPM